MARPEDLEADPEVLAAAYKDALEEVIEDFDAQSLRYEERARRDEERRMMWPVVWALVAVGLAVIALCWAIAG